MKDYFLLLPEKYFEGDLEQRTHWMLDPKRGAVIDSLNGYLYAPGDGAQASIWVCLFKRLDGTVLIGVKTHPSDTNEITYLEFYSYDHGRWSDVTRRVLPISVDDALNYEMPRHGTTIKVTNRRGTRHYDLIWTKDVFKLRRN